MMMMAVECVVTEPICRNPLANYSSRYHERIKLSKSSSSPTLKSSSSSSPTLKSSSSSSPPTLKSSSPTLKSSSSSSSPTLKSSSSPATLKSSSPTSAHFQPPSRHQGDAEMFAKPKQQFLDDESGANTRRSAP